MHACSSSDLPAIRMEILLETTPYVDSECFPLSLKPLDIEIMKRLGTRVNLIPVIAKADTLTQSDLAVFKQRVSQFARLIPSDLLSKCLVADSRGYRCARHSCVSTAH
jgi:hypothetical protein